MKHFKFVFLENIQNFNYVQGLLLLLYLIETKQMESSVTVVDIHSLCEIKTSFTVIKRLFWFENVTVLKRKQFWFRKFTIRKKVKIILQRFCWLLFVYEQKREIERVTEGEAGWNQTDWLISPLDLPCQKPNWKKKKRRNDKNDVRKTPCRLQTVVDADIPVWKISSDGNTPPPPLLLIGDRPSFLSCFKNCAPH